MKAFSDFLRTKLLEQTLGSGAYVVPHVIKVSDDVETHHLYSTSDAQVIKYDPVEDEVEWIFEDASEPENIVVDAEGFVYTYSGQFVFKIDDEGDEVWQEDLGEGAIQDIAVDPEGNVYVAVKQKAIALDGDGVEKWQFTEPTNATTSIDVDEDGFVVVGSEDGFVRRADDSGDLDWDTDIGSPVQAVAISPIGFVYAGTDAGEVHKLATIDGTEQNTDWPFEDPTDAVKDLAADLEGNVYFTFNNTVQKINSEAENQWDEDLGSTITRIAVDPFQAVYATVGTQIRRIEREGNDTTTGIWPEENHSSPTNGIVVHPGRAGAFSEGWPPQIYTVSVNTQVHAYLRTIEDLEEGILKGLELEIGGVNHPIETDLFLDYDEQDSLRVRQNNNSAFLLEANTNSPDGTLEAQQQVYAALFTDNPSSFGLGGEVDKNGYERALVPFGSVSNGLAESDEDLTFGPADEDWGTVLYVGLLDQFDGGNLLYFGEIETPRDIEENDKLELLSGNLRVNIG